MFRWNRFIRLYHSSFHSITIERGPMPSAAGGLSAFFPNIKYDLETAKNGEMKYIFQDDGTKEKNKRSIIIFYEEYAMYE